MTNQLLLQSNHTFNSLFFIQNLKKFAYRWWIQDSIHGWLVRKQIFVYFHMLNQQIVRVDLPGQFPTFLMYFLTIITKQGFCTWCKFWMNNVHETVYEFAQPVCNLYCYVLSSLFWSELVEKYDDQNRFDSRQFCNVGAIPSHYHLLYDKRKKTKFYRKLSAV